MNYWFRVIVTEKPKDELLSRTPIPAPFDSSSFCQDPSEVSISRFVWTWKAFSFLVYSNENAALVTLFLRFGNWNFLVALADCLVN